MGIDAKGRVGVTVTGFIFLVLDCTLEDTGDIGVLVIKSPHIHAKLPYLAYVGKKFVLDNLHELHTLPEQDQLCVYEGMLLYDPDSR